MALGSLTSPGRRRMPCVNRNIGRPTPRRLATCVKKPSLAVLVLGPPIDMASPNFLWARHVYLPFTVIVLLGAQLIWAQSCYDGILPRLTSFEPPDTPSTGHLFTSPTPEPSSSPPPPPPPPQVLRLRLRDVTAASVDGYAYQGCMIDDSSNRVLGAARIDNNNMAPTLCRNL
jgi:hypothetical protein